MVYAYETERPTLAAAQRELANWRTPEALRAQIKLTEKRLEEMAQYRRVLRTALNIAKHKAHHV